MIRKESVVLIKKPIKVDVEKMEKFSQIVPAMRDISLITSSLNPLNKNSLYFCSIFLEHF